MPDKYPMVETKAKDYKARTKRNIMESDGTLILNIGPLKTGTALAAKIAEEAGKPLMVVQLDQDQQPIEVVTWLYENEIQFLNVADPRESKAPGIY